MRLTAVLLLTACATTSSAPFGVEPGPHRVGFRTEGTISAWYPAARGGRQIRFRDYAGETLDEADRFLHGKLSESAMVDLFDTPMLATLDASPDGKRYPLIVMNGSVFDQAIVAEFIASHGFVVATDAAVGKWPEVDPARVRHVGNVPVKTWDFVIHEQHQRARDGAQRLLRLIRGTP